MTGFDKMRNELVNTERAVNDLAYSVVMMINEHREKGEDSSEFDYIFNTLHAISKQAREGLKIQDAVLKTNEETIYYCPVCGEILEDIYNSNYCPYCGTRHDMQKKLAKKRKLEASLQTPESKEQSRRLHAYINNLLKQPGINQIGNRESGAN